MITPEELIIEMMPFSKKLRKFCKNNPDFSSEALKREAQLKRWSHAKKDALIQSVIS